MKILQAYIALSHHYCSGNIPLIHLDLYRLKNVSSARELFFSEEEEAFTYESYFSFKWPELIEPLIENYWKIEISYAQKSGRHYEIRDPKNLLTFSTSAVARWLLYHALIIHKQLQNQYNHQFLIYSKDSQKNKF